jgi:hypothetical protein
MQYGYWKVLVIRKHRMAASWRHLVPGAFIGSLCVLAAAGMAWIPALWAAVGLVALYAIATFAASLAIAARSEWVLFPVLPVVVACFHFGYGYGFLRGIWDFVILNNAPEAKFVQLTRERAPKPDSVQS